MSFSHIDANATYVVICISLAFMPCLLQYFVPVCIFSVIFSRYPCIVCVECVTVCSASTQNKGNLLLLVCFAHVGKPKIILRMLMLCVPDSII